MFKQFLTIIVAFAFPALHLLAADETPVHADITFCAPQNDIYPFYLSENGVLSGINPELIRQVFNQDKLPEVTFSITLRPWKRCNMDLENGAVDMMIGGYDANRENVVYPSKLGFNLSDSAISTADVCFYSIAGNQMKRTQSGLKGDASFVVGIEAGFTKQHRDEIRVKWLELFNPIEKYRMLEKGRVDAIVQVCSMDSKYQLESRAETAGYKNFVKLDPPYLSNPAYPVFSENFANEHRDLAKRIVTLFQEVDREKVYSRYQPRK